MQVYSHYKDFPSQKWKWPNFSPKEMACRGDNKLAINGAAMDKLQALRVELGNPLIINSAYRSPAYNKRIGGASKSQHLEAKAFDISMTNHVPEVFEKAARKVGFTGFGFYPKSNFIHIDIGRQREWGKRWWKKGSKALSEPPIRAPETIREDKDLVGVSLSGGGLVAVATQLFPAISGLSETAQIIAVAGMIIAGAAVAYVMYRKVKRHV